MKYSPKRSTYVSSPVKFDWKVRKSPTPFDYISSDEDNEFINKSGWIPDSDNEIDYLLENEAYPGFFKIGKTKKYIGKTPEECIQRRIRGYQTGTPSKLIIKAYIITKDAYKIEQIIHAILNKYKCNNGGGTEWFTGISLRMITELFRYVKECYDYIDYMETKKYKMLSYLPTIYDMKCGPMIIEYQI